VVAGVVEQRLVPEEGVKFDLMGSDVVEVIGGSS
jgi:hypothetical protein